MWLHTSCGHYDASFYLILYALLNIEKKYINLGSCFLENQVRSHSSSHLMLQDSLSIFLHFGTNQEYILG